MMQSLFIILVVFIALVLFGAVMFMRNDKEDKAVTYVCSECGEMDCDCHVEPE